MLRRVLGDKFFQLQLDDELGPTGMGSIGDEALSALEVVEKLALEAGAIRRVRTVADMMYKCGGKTSESCRLVDWLIG